MTTVAGRYVRTFAEATHALPDGMHMNADYPFMLPKIVARGEGTITIEGRRANTRTLEIRTGKRGEFCELAQSSTYERFLNQQPTTFTFYPFKADK